ncbi:hypothetical protein [Curvibacter lanceolatus]|uniref:hypothetical protein n=1 Tax=Curvibacter lanceolatus TaxID=86182 RepID=UPI0012F9A7B0|nr:hypothetical protein [Curvibacter lanceolatus]
MGTDRFGGQAFFFSAWLSLAIKGVEGDGLMNRAFDHGKRIANQPLPEAVDELVATQA